MTEQKSFLTLLEQSDNFPIFKMTSNKMNSIHPINQNFNDGLCLSEDLSPIELKVLKIAQEILKLKRYSATFEVNSHCQIGKYPILEKLYAKCIAKLRYSNDYSKEQIFQAIQSLENKNWIVSNHRRTKEEILNNKKYGKVLTFIQNNPGIHACDQKIERELGLTRTPFLKYIIILENFGLIRSTKFGKRLHFFSIDFPKFFEKITVILSNPLVWKILGEIVKNSYVSIYQIGQNLDFFPNAIQYHLRKLQEENLIRIEMRGFRKRRFIFNLSMLEKYIEITKNHELAKYLNFCI